MAGVKFTPSQQEAIEKKGTNIIVSAGAGSGKYYGGGEEPLSLRPDFRL